MPAQCIAYQAIPRHTIQTLEALAHVRGSSRQVDSRCPSPAEHAQTPSSTRTNCSSAPVSNPRPTSIRRPLRSTTANALPAAPMGAGARPHTSTANSALLPADACRCCRLRYRPRVLNATPRSRQNSIRLNPLDSYSATTCSTSCQLRRRRNAPTCSSFMPLLHHQTRCWNRWDGLTLTFVPPTPRECFEGVSTYGPCSTGWATSLSRPRCAIWRRPPTFNDELDLVTIPSPGKADAAPRKSAARETRSSRKARAAQSRAAGRGPAVAPGLSTWQNRIFRTAWPKALYLEIMD